MSADHPWLTGLQFASDVVENAKKEPVRQISHPWVRHLLPTKTNAQGTKQEAEKSAPVEPETASATAEESSSEASTPATEVNFKFENLDYDKIMESSELTESLKSEVAESIANSINVPQSSVEVQLSKGSVVVKTHVFCKDADAAVLIKKQIDESGKSLMQSVENCVTQIPMIAEAVEDGKVGLGVAGLRTAVTEVIREVETPTEENAPSDEKPFLEDAIKETGLAGGTADWIKDERGDQHQSSARDLHQSKEKMTETFRDQPLSSEVKDIKEEQVAEATVEPVLEEKEAAATMEAVAEESAAEAAREFVLVEKEAEATVEVVLEEKATEATVESSLRDDLLCQQRQPPTIYEGEKVTEIMVEPVVEDKEIEATVEPVLEVKATEATVESSLPDDVPCQQTQPPAMYQEEEVSEPTVELPSEEKEAEATVEAVLEEKAAEPAVESIFQNAFSGEQRQPAAMYQQEATEEGSVEAVDQNLLQEEDIKIIEGPSRDKAQPPLTIHSRAADATVKQGSGSDERAHARSTTPSKTRPVLANSVLPTAGDHSGVGWSAYSGFGYGASLQIRGMSPSVGYGGSLQTSAMSLSQRAYQSVVLPRVTSVNGFGAASLGTTKPSVSPQPTVSSPPTQARTAFWQNVNQARVGVSPVRSSAGAISRAPNFYGQRLQNPKVQVVPPAPVQTRTHCGVERNSISSTSPSYPFLRPVSVSRTDTPASPAHVRPVSPTGDPLTKLTSTSALRPQFRFRPASRSMGPVLGPSHRRSK